MSDSMSDSTSDRQEAGLVEAFRDFLKDESAAGLILMGTAFLAIVIANSPLSVFYDMLITMPVEIRVGAFEIAKPLLLWVNDGLMAVFFFLVGLELKRELLEGELSQPGAMSLPLAGAVGGMAVPALIYLLINRGDEVAMSGWAIPAATDIAFALGILSLLGSRVPVSLKVFLVSLAIFDDIGAIVIIALFYSSKLSLLALGVGAVCVAILAIMNRRGQMRVAPYIVVGVVMWVAVLKSGVHATLAGIVLALFIPLRDERRPSHSPLRELEHDLHGAVAFFILPVFAFANAGVSLSGVGWGALLHPVPLGIASGLVVGKLVGIFSACYLLVKLGMARLPEGMNWGNLLGLSLLCGVGFTMSLFIGSLAFEESGVDMLFDERLGILMGSMLAGIGGYLVLHRVLPRGS